MLLSSVLTLGAFVLAGVVYLLSPEGVADLSNPAFWVFTTLILVGAIAGNLRMVALTTTVTLLVPVERHDRANGVIGTASGIAFAITSVFSGLGVGLLGMGFCVAIAAALTALATLHLLTIHVDEPAPTPHENSPRFIDVGGSVQAVRVVPGLLALLLFATFNNFLGGAFMALLDPYGLSLVAVEEWGVILALTSLGFVFGGFTVARRGLGRNPVRTLLVVNLVMWTVTIVFPIRSEVLPLMVGFLFYMTLIPFAEASEQTIIQKVVPFTEQGRVFGLSQALESAASPITAFLIGPIAQFWIIPSMTDGGLAAAIGPWFGTGPARAMALIFMVFGVIGLVVTLLALRSRYYRELSGRYLGAPPDDDAGAQQPEAAAA